MKLLKFIGMLLIAMIMCVNFIACGDDENSEKLDLSLLEGTWYVTHEVYYDYVDGKIVFTADSDAIITKGIISLLIRVFSGRTPMEIIDADLNFIKEIGLEQNLSPTRANGLLAMIKKIKFYAMAFAANKQ